jgi:hypothetical protein
MALERIVRSKLKSTLLETIVAHARGPTIVETSSQEKQGSEPDETLSTNNGFILDSLLNEECQNYDPRTSLHFHSPPCRTRHCEVVPSMNRDENSPEMLIKKSSARLLCCMWKGWITCVSEALLNRQKVCPIGEVCKNENAWRLFPPLFLGFMPSLAAAGN